MKESCIMPCNVPDLENECNESACPRLPKGSRRALFWEMLADVTTEIPFRSWSMLDYLRHWGGFMFCVTLLPCYVWHYIAFCYIFNLFWEGACMRNSVLIKQYWIFSSIPLGSVILLAFSFLFFFFRPDHHVNNDESKNHLLRIECRCLWCGLLCLKANN